MPTSGVTAWSLTAEQFILAALKRTGVIALGETPTSDEITECINIFNGILRSMPPGDHLQETGTVTVPAGDPSGSLPIGVSDIISARVVESSTYERILVQWGRSEYLVIPNKTVSGSPTAFYADKQISSVALYVWPVPVADTTLAIEYIRFPETITASSQTVDFPERYNEYLQLELGLNCADLFGREPSQLLAERARRLRDMFEDESRPESYMLGPDYY